MAVLTFASLALLFSLAVLVYVVTEDWRCSKCGAYRSKQPDGWRRCDPCRRGWRID